MNLNLNFKKNSKYILFIFILNLLVTGSVKAAKDTITIADFPFVAQGHGNGNNFCNGKGNSSYLNVYNEATIWGTEGLNLNFCSSFESMSNTSCDNYDGSLRKCSISFTEYSPKKLKTFNNPLGNRTISCSSNKLIFSSDLKSFDGYQGCNAGFITTSYKIKTMNMYQGSTVHFYGGEYWIDTLTMQNSSKIIIHGNVKIHLKSKSEFNGAEIEYADQPSQLIVVSRDSIALNSSSKLEGYFYADKSISLNNGSVILGRVNSQILTLTNNSQINNENIIPRQCTPLPEENFNSGSLSNWSVMDFRNSDDSDYPGVYGGHFVLNSNEPEQATASAYNYTFPSDQNYLEIEFDHYAYGGTGADGVALVISDASVPPKTGAFGGPLGYGMKLYKNHSNEISQDVEGFAGGWLGIGIDEYGNFYREGSVELAGHGIADNVGIRGAGIRDDNGKWLKGYEYIKGQKYGKSLDNRPYTPHRYKVILNSRDSGAIILSVWRKVGDSEDWGEPVIEEFDLLKEGGFNYIPDNFRISVTASTGALTNTHEIDNFQVCADKYQKITNGIHHFEFEYAKTGSICQASDVILRACMNESCSETYPSSITGGTSGSSLDPVTVSLLPVSSSTVSWEGGNSVTFSDSVALKLRAHQSGSAKLGIAKIENDSIIQLGFTGTRCLISGALTEDNCKITFNSAALGVNVPDKVAGKQFFNDDGQAQYSNQNSPYLEFCSSPSQQGGNGENRDIQLSIERKEPINNAVSIPAYVSFKQRDGSFSSEVLVGTSSVDIADVYFNSQGKAYFDLRYPEAGKVALKAKIKGEEDSLGQNSFVSFPEYLTVTTDGECNSGSCQNGFVAAGEPFTMTVTAHQFGGAEAKNYQQTGLAISHKVSYPTSASAVPGKLNVSVYDHTQPENGAVSIDEQTVSEVGAFEFTVTPPDSYLGSNAFPIAPAVANIGRFYPKYFRIYDSVDNEWAYPSGQSFTYMGQSFGAAEFYVEALNSAKGSVNNYQFFESKLQTQFSLKDSGSYTSRFSALKTYSGNWQSNQLTGVDSRSIGRFGSSASNGFIMHKDMESYQPDGPLNLYQNGSDTEISINGFGIGENVDPVAVDGNDGLLSIQPDIRFGRVDLDDVGGRQGDTLRIPLRVEYWNSNLKRFVQNVDDDGTVIYSELDGDPQLIWPNDKSDCSILLEGNDTVTDGATRELSARQDPNTCNSVGRQQSRLWLQLKGGSNNLPWLKYDWDNDGSEENPSSVVTFGIHRGNDRVIYRGEPGLTAQ
nr:DUF6701 domain-containing protein [uncultured Vibrio sp.]